MDKHNLLPALIHSIDRVGVFSILWLCAQVTNVIFRTETQMCHLHSSVVVGLIRVGFTSHQHIIVVVEFFLSFIRHMRGDDVFVEVFIAALIHNQRPHPESLMLSTQLFWNALLLIQRWLLTYLDFSPSIYSFHQLFPLFFSLKMSCYHNHDNRGPVLPTCDLPQLKICWALMFPLCITWHSVSWFRSRPSALTLCLLMSTYWNLCFFFFWLFVCDSTIHDQSALSIQSPGRVHIDKKS